MVANFSAKPRVSTWQNSSLSTPWSGKRLRWQVVQTGGGFQPFVHEIAFKSSDGSWLPNHATKAAPAPIKTFSGWQKSNNPEPNSGFPTCAMDGNTSTWWDPKTEAAWLDLVWPSKVTITDVALMTHGDGIHDILKFELLATPPSNSSANSSAWKALPPLRAAAIVIEARAPFESFAPMELAANETEVAALVKSRGSPPYLVFTEPREMAVRMQNRIPERWLSAPAAPSVSASVRRGEYFTWQIALFVPPGAQRLENVSLSCVDFDALPTEPT